jgi:hypothetical protein
VLDKSLTVTDIYAEALNTDVLRINNRIAKQDNHRGFQLFHIVETSSLGGFTGCQLPKEGSAKKARATPGDDEKVLSVE